MKNSNSLKERIKQSKIHAKVKEFILTTATLMAVCTGVQAQTKEKEQKDDREGFKTEVNVGFSNISALEVQKNKAVFYNDLMPTLNAGIEKDGFYGNITAAELLVMNNGEWSAMNNKCLLEIGKHFGNDTKLFLKAGREPTEVGSVFFNGVENMKYDTNAKSIPFFGNLNERVVLGVQKNGTMIELGMVGSYGNGIFIIPNPKQADFWAKVTQSFKNNGWTVTLTAATELGHTNKVLGSVTATNGQIGITGGGNYDFNDKGFNAFIRGAYTSINTGLTYVAQGLKKGETYSAQLGVGKNGVQGFVAVENITPSQNKAPEFTSTPTVNFGVSYSFGGSRKL
ncbi:MAG: hypothetical protein IJS26_05980 [Alphaproteobacteria bacterium]|nr:hypothetical protein [Alphaproteobacteria bacterium]